MKKYSLLIILLLLPFAIAVFNMSCQSTRTCYLLKGMDCAILNTANNDTLQSMDSVQALNLKLLVDLDIFRFSCQTKKSFSLINEALAYKPSMDFVSYDTVKKITITSNQNFDATHPAGSSLNSYFGIEDSMNENIANYRTGFYTLKNKPDSALWHELKISVLINNSPTYDSIFPPIKILN